MSRVGDGVYKISLAWWVLEKTGSAVAMSKVLVCSVAPMLLFVLVGGAAGDRLSRVRVMLVADVARGVGISLVGVLAFRQELEVWHVYLVSILLGLASAFFQPSYAAVIPQLVPREALRSANSLTSLSKQVSDIVGPVIGAVVVKGVGTAAAFALNGGSFLLSAVCLIPLLQLPLEVRRSAGRQSVVGDIREGIGIVLASPYLWITIALASLLNITWSAPVIVALPFLIREDLRINVHSLGAAYSMMAAGSLVGTIWLGRSSRIRRRGRVAYGALLTMGIANIIVGLSTSAIGIGMVMFVSGAAASVFTLIWVNTQQELVPGELLGRASSIDTLTSALFFPVGVVLVGWGTDKIGAPLIFIVGGCLTFVLTAAALAHPAIKNLD